MTYQTSATQSLPSSVGIIPNFFDPPAPIQRGEIARVEPSNGANPVRTNRRQKVATYLGLLVFLSCAAWAEVIAADEWSWLTALDPAWDLFEVDEETWVNEHVAAKLGAAFTAIRRPGLHIAVITKVLHIKRPALIPVLDSLVIGQIGGRVSVDIATWVAVLEHVRAIGKSNLEALRAIRIHLQSEDLQDRSLVRILDSLLWTCAPGSALSGELAGWERVFRPRPAADPD